VAHLPELVADVPHRDGRVVGVPLDEHADEPQHVLAVDR